MKKITVIGAGSWGTALANILADNNHNTFLYSKNPIVVDEVNTAHTNNKYLPGAVLNKKIIGISDLELHLKDSDFVLFVVPSHAMRETANKYNEFINKNAIIIHASKGFEIDSVKSMTQVLKDELDPVFHNKIVTFSGPSHAEEVIRKMPTAIVSACENQVAAEEVQKLFSNNYIRVYTSLDSIGVELGGSIKNIIAIGAGLIDGLGYGDNTKAALLTRGLAEMSKLGLKLNADPRTFKGLAGVGDLIVTGTSKHSRNWKTGNELSKGKNLDEVLESLGMVAEGVKTTKAFYKLSKELDVELPITNEIYNILFNGKDPKLAISDLMSRKSVDEFYFYN